MGAVESKSGGGFIAFDNAQNPCTVMLQASLQFPANAIGLPSEETIAQTMGLKVQDNTSCK
jgi:hypothetical protein